MADATRTTRDPTITQAIERLKLSRDAYHDQVKREKDDLAFQVPESQWPEAVRTHRKAAMINGIPLPERPMLSIATLDQPIQLALNQERQAQLGVQVHPLTEDADDETAEIIQGLYRRIETDSRAHIARSWAHERAVKAGRGAYRVNKVLDPSSPDPKDQKIVIQRILRQESVYPDPFAQEPDWSDGRFCFVTAWIPWDRYKAKYPKSRLAGFDNAELVALDQEAPGWMRDEGESRAVLIAEYWRVEFNDADGTRRVFWSTINAVEAIELEQEWDGQYIPIVMTIGRELIPFDQERRWVGIIGPNKDGARLVNYAASGLVEAAALEPRAPFDVDPEEIEGFEGMWGQANVRNFPYLLRHKWKGQREFGPVQRIQADGSKMQLNAVLLEQGREFVRIGTGAYDPTLGKSSSAQEPAKKVMALQQQHEASNSHWLDNLAQVSLMYEARVVLDLIPHVYDRPGRVAMILDLEDTPQQVILNAPFVKQGKRAMPVPEGMSSPSPLPAGAPQGGAPEVKRYDLSKGRYDVTVSIGKAYKSRLEHGQNALGQLFQAAPGLIQLLGDLYLKFLDFPGHTEAAERLKKMLPPQVQDGEQGQPSVTALQAQLQQAGQQIALLSKELETRVKQIETEEAKGRVQAELAQLEHQSKVQIEEMKNATAIRIAEINAAVKGYQTEAEHAAQHEAQALNIQADAVEADLEREQDAHEAERQRQHERDTAREQVAGQLAITAAKPQPTKGA